MLQCTRTDGMEVKTIFQNIQNVLKKLKKTSPPKSDDLWLHELFECNLLSPIMEDYVSLCLAQANESSGSMQKRSLKHPPLPNLAGFCRYLKTDVDTVVKVGKAHPSEFGRIMAILEDEALNSDASATIISSYMKKRLNYERSTEESLAPQSTTVTFEHDIFSDGE